MRRAKVLVAGVAGRQFGRISRAQLRYLSIDDRTIQDWLSQGYLHRVLRRVYAVGHLAKTTEADLAAAVLYAGPGAMLSHGTAAWWVGLANSKPYVIDVSTPRRCKSAPGVRVYERRVIEREWHNGLPVTPFTQTLIDYATRASLGDVRRALAQADYNGGFDALAIEFALRRGRPGSTMLRRAIANHRPALAYARSRLEVALFELCEAGGLPLPELNGEVAGWTVDALWRRERLVVEVDGPGNHRTPAQIRRDRRKEFELRAAGLVVLRYADEQVYQRAWTVAAEICRNLTNPEPSA